MTVRMLAWKSILVFRQRIVVLVINETLAQIPVTSVPAALISQEKILRQGVGFVPCIRDRFVWPSFLFGAAQSFLRQVWQHRIRRALQHSNRIRICREFM